jgi:regulator of sirC expression with transglutaminase-like and TPR domain
MIDSRSKVEVSQNVSHRSVHWEQLEAIGHLPDDEIELAPAALCLAALDRADGSLEPYRSHLAALAADVAALGHRGGDLDGRSWAIGRVLFERHGYAGDRETYEDLRNADLMSVIDRRKGIPVSLGILYAHIGRAMGWTITGLDFPSHFLLRLEGNGLRLIVDPFDEGRIMAPEDLRALAKSIFGSDAELEQSWFEPVGNRDILLRLQNNIRTRSIQAGELERGAEITRRMMALAPDATNLKRDLGMVEAHIGNVGAAIEALASYLQTGPRGADKAEVEKMLNKLRRALN